jgi:serine/threonine protein kinase
LYQRVGELASPFPAGGASVAEYVGQQLGNYRLIQLLGQGNFSGVYLDEHLHLNTQAAIKVLHGQLANHDMAGFLTEARTIAHLRHPHIVQVLDFGVEGTTPFLVMEYAPGGNLRQRHPKGTPLLLQGDWFHTGYRRFVLAFRAGSAWPGRPYHSTLAC